MTHVAVIPSPYLALFVVLQCYGQGAAAEVLSMQNDAEVGIAYCWQSAQQVQLRHHTKQWITALMPRFQNQTL